MDLPALFSRWTRLVAIILLAWMVLHGVFSTGSFAADGELELTIVDSETKLPIPVRVEFTNARGRAVKLRSLGEGHLGEHFYLQGKSTLPLRRGGYRFLLDAGSEYRTQLGHFEIERHADDAKTVEMRRFANLSEEGWWAGDVDHQRADEVLPIVTVAEGIHYAPATAWRYASGKWKPAGRATRRRARDDPSVVAGRAMGPVVAVVESAGGDLLLVGTKRFEQAPVDLSKATNLQVLAAARSLQFRTVALTPTAWELPVWIAGGDLDAVALLTRQSEWKGVVDKDPNGRPRDRTFFPGSRGLARWGETIYFHWMNAGVRLAPVAGSGSGANESPLGTNRAYVHLDGKFSADAWWQGVRDGAVVVTNGPLLRPSVGGDPPGTTFRIDAGETIDFRIALNLASRQTVDYLEILKNGQVEAEVRLDDWAKSGGRLPPVTFDGSGWFAVRAVTDNRDKYQLALSAPFYVESPAGPRISRASVEFFLEWLDDLEARLEKHDSLTKSDLAMARAFWKESLARANAP